MIGTFTIITLLERMLMSKPIAKTITLNISHLEAALAGYLKPFFPEAIEVEGVDISLHMSKDNAVEATVYLRQKTSKAANDNTEALEAEVIPFEEVKKDSKRAEKPRKRPVVAR